jgi:TRAP transporter 4TM/12TM fusion protein
VAETDIGTGEGQPAQRLGGFGHALVQTCAVVLSLGSIAWAADLYRAVGLVLYNEQFYAAMLGITLPLAYLKFPLVKGRSGPVPLYDAVIAAVAFVSCCYVAWVYPRFANVMAEEPLDALVVSAIILILIVEGLRRSVGNVLVILLLAFLAYAMWGHHVPGRLVGRELVLTTIVIQIALDPQSLLGIPMKIATTIVIAFVFLGHVLLHSGGSAFFTNISMAAVGRYRGGSAKIAVTASGFFGSISGSAVSNVVSTGVITIPLMRQSGYTAEAAGGIEAVASTGGQLMPPIMGATAFVMAEYLEVPYTDVVIAALVPAILYYTALFIVTDLEAARTGIASVDESELPRFWASLKAGWFFPLPFGVLIYALFGLNESPETSALYASVVLFVCAAVFGYEGRRMGLGGLYNALRDTGSACIDIILIVAAAGLVIGLLNLSGLSFGLTYALGKLGEGNLLLLLVIAAGLCILLGMGMPTLAVYVLVASLVAPSIVQFGIDKMAAHLFVLYYGMMSMITPPIAIAAFAAATLTHADQMKTAVAAVRFGWIAYVLPFLIIASPTLIMKGATLDIVIDVATAFIGVWLVSFGLMGYFVRPLDLVMRLGFAVAGIGAFVPIGAFAGASTAIAAGIVLGGLLAGRELIGRRRAAA